MLPMLRTLLEERFQLKVHTETRELPISALVVRRDDRRLGPNVKPSALDGSNPAQPQPAEMAAALERAGRKWREWRALRAPRGSNADRASVENRLSERKTGELAAANC